MFTILGATGNTGAIVARTLLARGQAVRVVVRDPGKVEGLRAAGAEVVVGDVLDAASLTAAFAGAQGAYVLIPPDLRSDEVVARGRRIATNLATALGAAKVPHAVLLSSVAAHLPAGTGPIVTVFHAERALREVPGLRLTALRAAYFMDNLGMYAHPMKADGALPVFGGGEGYPFPMVSTRDIGRVAAEALLAAPAGHEIIELSGPQEYSFADGAAAATALLGRPVVATPLPIEGMVPALTSMGVSTDMAKLYEEMTRSSGAGTVRFEGVGRALRGEVTLPQALAPMLA